MVILRIMLQVKNKQILILEKALFKNTLSKKIIFLHRGEKEGQQTAPPFIHTSHIRLQH